MVKRDERRGGGVKRVAQETMVANRWVLVND